MAALLSLFGSRFGLAGAVAAALALVISIQQTRIWSITADLADSAAQVATLKAEIATQNAAVEKMRADGMAASQAASQRAAAALKPHPKPALRTVEELNTWLAP